MRLSQFRVNILEFVGQFENKKKSLSGSAPLETIRQSDTRKMSFVGLTLIEIMVVVVILGILVTLVIPQYKKVMERSRQSEAYVNLGVLRGAQIRYYTEYGDYGYGSSWSSLDIDEITDTEYFAYTLPADSGWTATCVGRATREAAVQNPGYGVYTMDIAPDGTVTKSSGAP